MKRVFFAVATVAIFTLASCQNGAQTQSQEETVEVVESTSTPDYVYVNVEMVLAQSDIFTSEGVKLQEKSQKAQEGWVKKEQGFQYEASKLQEKYQKGLITTANAQKEQASIEQRLASFQQSTQKEMQQLEEENAVFSNRTMDLVRRAVDKINVDNKYKMIVNASSLIHADTTLDITPIVLEAVNALYAEEKSEE